MFEITEEIIFKGNKVNKKELCESTGVSLETVTDIEEYGLGTRMAFSNEYRMTKESCDGIDHFKSVIYRLMGEWFGYNECCIEAFVTRSEEEGDIPTDDNRIWCGSGYVPCEKCAKELDKLTSRTQLKEVTGRDYWNDCSMLDPFIAMEIDNPRMNELCEKYKVDKEIVLADKAEDMYNLMHSISDMFGVKVRDAEELKNIVCRFIDTGRIKHTLVDELDLSERAKNNLKSNNIYTLIQVQSLTETDLLKMKNLYRKDNEDITKYLKK